MQKKLALIFPGIGYNMDKPLLHYARRIVTEAGYEVLVMPYLSTDFEEGRVTEAGIQRAYQMCQRSLIKYDMSDFKEVLLIGKSVGTLLAGMCISGLTGRSQAELRFLMLTPLSPSFPYMKGRRALALAGTKDPVVNEELLQTLAEEYEVPLTLYESANHSLEVRGNPGRSVEILADVVQKIQLFINMDGNDK